MLRLIAVALIVASFELTGCNTIEGMGEDIETAGQEIEQEAEEFN